MLSCGCPDNDDADWFFCYPSDFIKLTTKRRKRCISCGTLIDIGAYCLEFKRFRYPNTFVEEKIYGEDGEVAIASHFHCEKCGEQYFNLKTLGFCMHPEDNMIDCLNDYITGIYAN